MRKEFPTAVNTILITALLAANSACNPRKTSAIEISPKIAPSSETAPITATPFKPSIEISPTPEPSAIPTLTTEQRFTIGSHDFGTSRLTIEIPPELKATLGYTDLKPIIYTVDKPMKVVLPYLDPEIDGAFASAGRDNKNGNPSIVYLTDKTNLIVEYVHSLLVTAPGESARIIGRFLLKNPEKENEIIGKEMIITPYGGEPIVATIADVRTITEEAFQDDYSEHAFWGRYPDENILIARTDSMGLPDAIRNDYAPGVYYLTIISCQPRDGELQVSDNWEADSYHNTRNRTLLTLRIVIGN